MTVDTKDLPDPLARVEPLAGNVARNPAASDVTQVLQETVRISKREAETGRVSVHKAVSERDETVRPRTEHVDIEQTGNVSVLVTHTTQET